MQIDIALSAPLATVGDQARGLEALGLDGGYTFEYAHDVFFPLLEAPWPLGRDACAGTSFNGIHRMPVSFTPTAPAAG